MVYLKQMEATVLGLKQLRSFIGKGSGQEMLDARLWKRSKRLRDQAKGIARNQIYADWRRL